MAISRSSLGTFAPAVGEIYRGQLGYLSLFGRSVGYANVSIKELIAESGEVLLGLQNASLLKAWVITSENADFIISGQSAGLYAERLIVCDSFDIDLSVSGNLLYNRLFTASPAAYNINLIDTNLLFNRLLSAANGAYTVDLQDGELTLTITDKGYDVEFILGIATQLGFSLSIGRDYTFVLKK